MAEGIAQHQRTDLHAPRRLSQRREYGPALPDPPGRLTGGAIEEVVGEPDTIEAVRFRLLRGGADRIIRTRAVGFAVVGQEDHQPNLHGLPSAFSATASEAVIT